MNEQERKELEESILDDMLNEISNASSETKIIDKGSYGLEVLVSDKGRAIARYADFLEAVKLRKELDKG